MRFQKAVDDELLCDAPERHKEKPMRKVTLNSFICGKSAQILY